MPSIFTLSLYSPSYRQAFDSLLVYLVSLVDQFCCLLSNSAYSGSSTVDVTVAFKELTVGMQDSMQEVEPRKRKEYERKRDKRMNWRIIINESDCSLHLQYHQLLDMEMGMNVLLPSPSVDLLVGVILTYYVDPRYFNRKRIGSSSRLISSQQWYFDLYFRCTLRSRFSFRNSFQLRIIPSQACRFVIDITSISTSTTPMLCWTN